MMFKTKQKGTLKAGEIHQAEQILFRFVQNESLPNVSKSIANSKEISKILNINKLSPFIDEDGIIRVNGRLKHSNFDYKCETSNIVKSETSSCTIFVGESPS